MTFRTQITKDETVVDPEVCREGDAIPFEVVVEGVVTGITSPTMTMYKEGSTSDVSGDYLTGSMSVSGVDTILTKTTTGLKAGWWIISVSATVDSVVQIVATIPLLVKRRSER